MKKRVFITWNGRNERLAVLVAKRLSDRGLLTLVGGHNHQRETTISETVHIQMGSCDYAIILVEKTESGFSENVMYEWGYLTARLDTPSLKRVMPFLINSSPNELPSNLLGHWVDSLTVGKDEGDFERTADDVCRQFCGKLDSYDTDVCDKLSYFSSWESNRVGLFEGKLNENMAEILLYSFQAAVYYDDLQRVDNALGGITSGSEDLKAVIRCIRAMLRVFTDTKGLQEKLSFDNFLDIEMQLRDVEDDSFIDEDLGAWCRIFAKDKLSLAYLFTDSEDSTEDNRSVAMSLSNEVYEAIQAQIAANPADEMYGNLYLSFQERNRAEIVRMLYDGKNTCEVDGVIYDEAFEKEERRLAFEHRKKVYTYYKKTYREDMICDCLSQEYVLSMAEWMPYIEKESERKRCAHEIRRDITKLKARMKRQEMVWSRIRKAFPMNNETEETT